MYIVFYSNCQQAGLKYFLQKVFQNAHFEHIINYDLIMNKTPIPINILNSANIFIYQPIIDKGIYSTNNENILSFLPPKCIKISFPYIYNDSLWIFIPINKDRIFEDTYFNKETSYDKIINKEPIEELKKKVTHMKLF